MTNQEIADKISDMMGQGKTGLKKGYTDEYANELLEKAKLNALLDENKQLRAGLQDFSKTREMIKLDELVATTPTSPRERNQQLRDLRIVLTDESSTVAGAEKIHENLENYFGEKLSINKTINLLNVMGKAELKGVRFSGKVEYDSVVSMINERMPEGKISPEDVEEMADVLVAKHKLNQGLPLSEEDKRNLENYLKTYGETPKVSVDSYDPDTDAVDILKWSKSKSKNEAKVDIKDGKLSEATVHRGGKAKPKKY